MQAINVISRADILNDSLRYLITRITVTITITIRYLNSMAFSWMYMICLFQLRSEVIMTLRYLYLGTDYGGHTGTEF